MKYISICSGIEAATVAWHQLGWKPLAFSEIEDFPSALLAHHYPNIPNLGDMTKFYEWDIDTLANTDILVGGTPCQAFSVAGLRAGLEDDRGQLTLTYIKLLDHIDNIRSFYGKEPAICVWENVPGVLSSKDNAFGAFLGGLAGENCELLPPRGKWSNSGCVYGTKRTIAWRILDAQYFGLAQRRKRVFVVASARDFDPSEILFEFDGVRRDTAPSRETGETATTSVRGSSTFQDTPILNDQGGSVMSVEDGLVGTLRRETHGHEPVVFSVISDPTPKVGEDICLTMRSQGGGGGGIVPPSVAFLDRAAFNQGENALYEPEITPPVYSTSTLVARGTHVVAFHHDAQAYQLPSESRDTSISDALTCSQHAAVACIGGQHPNAAICNDGSAPTLTSAMGTGGGHIPLTHQNLQIRRLTPIECERLQGFPDAYTRIPISFHKTKKVTKLRPEDQWEKTEDGYFLMSADGNRYKALGNSMAVPVMRWIGERIDNAIRMG